MFDKYAEHLAHSIDDGSRWDGFDRGDTDNKEYCGTDIIGRMPAIGGGKVVVTYEYSGFDELFCVYVRGNLRSYFETAGEAKAFARRYVATRH